MNRIFQSLTFIFVFSVASGALANKDLWDAAVAKKWDRFWGIRLKDPAADLDYREDGVSVRELVEESGYLDLLDPVELDCNPRPKLWPRVYPHANVAVRRHGVEDQIAAFMLANMEAGSMDLGDD